jgi:hypothetical protein
MNVLIVKAALARASCLAIKQQPYQIASTKFFHTASDRKNVPTKASPKEKRRSTTQTLVRDFSKYMPVIHQGNRNTYVRNHDKPSIPGVKQTNSNSEQ